MTADNAFHLKIRPSFWVLAAFLLLKAEEGRMIFLFFLACTAHELGHLAAACWLNLPVRSLTVSAVGLELSIDRTCSYGGELLLTAAGPAASFLLAVIACQLKGEGSSLLAGISFILGVFNLLPVQPLDGGELLRILLCLLLPPDSAFQVAQWVGYGFCGLAILFGLLLTLAGNPSLLLMGLWLAFGQSRSSR